MNLLTLFFVLFSITICFGCEMFHKYPNRCNKWRLKYCKKYNDRYDEVKCIEVNYCCNDDDDPNDDDPEYEFETDNPKNILIFIGDGHGATYNTAYRIYNELESTVIDNHFVGKMSIDSLSEIIINGESTISDSAASASTIATGTQTINGYVSVDDKLNPIGTIFEASKEKGKGVGVISTSTVSDGTPAAFTSHVFYRLWEDLIAFQQATMLNTDIDIIYGGGREHFTTPETDIENNFEEYGWNKYVQTKNELLSLNSYDLPTIGLFTDGEFPLYIDRKNNNEIPTLLDMTKKAIEQLSSHYLYKEKGYLLIIESEDMDICGHLNDIACIVNGIDEYYSVINYVIDNKDEDTLVIILSDHETGGLAIGKTVYREPNVGIQFGRLGPEFLDNNPLNGITNKDVFRFNTNIPPPPSLITNYGQVNPWKWYYEPIKYATKSSKQVYAEILANAVNINITNDASFIFDIIEEFYINPALIDAEKEFLIECYKSDPFLFDFLGFQYFNLPMFIGQTFQNCITSILNQRTLTGFTTYMHTIQDIHVSAIGPGKNEFIGHYKETDIAKKIIKLFNLENSLFNVQNKLNELFINDILILCDDNQPLFDFGVTPSTHGFSVGDQIPYPIGNLKYPGFCVFNFTQN